MRLASESAQLSLAQHSFVPHSGDIPRVRVKEKVQVMFVAPHKVASTARLWQDEIVAASVNSKDYSWTYSA